MHPDLCRMASEWKKRGITRHFPRIHHFYCPEFKSKPGSLEAFCKWCAPREIRHENTRTIARALEVVQLMGKGVSLNDAIKRAWKACPLVTRSCKKPL